MITFENPDQIYSMNLEELWNVITTLEDDEIQNKTDTLELIKNGINIKIPIYYLIQPEWIRYYPEYKTVEVTGYGKHKITDLKDEITERERKTRQLILKMLNNEKHFEYRKLEED
jgi:hypothetical protein